VNGDRLIRIAAAGVVAAVAAFAAVVSYSHIYDLGRGHGGSVLAARLLPLSVDGLILAMSLVMLHEARNGRPAPVLARCMLALGVTATLAANVAYGAAYGAVGAVIWAWPAVAFVGAVEVDLLLVRSARSTPAPVAVPAALGNGHAVPEGGAEAAELYAAELTRGEVPSVRRVRREMHLGQPRAQQVHAYLSALTRT
jgi:Protein of unknown function (DUF2637)